MEVGVDGSGSSGCCSAAAGSVIAAARGSARGEMEFDGSECSLEEKN